jgi:CO/xanthine dehydrogenase FAD-binding subunit
MIIEYNRPATLEDALALLARSEPLTLPLAGGSALNRPSSRAFAVVDLQDLGLDAVRKRGSFLELGATLTLQSLLDQCAEWQLPEALSRVIEHEASYNLRQVATVAGILVAADGRSSFATAMLSLDAAIGLEPGNESVGLGDLLPLRAERLRGRLITQVTLALNARLAYEYVARTPADLPIVCAAVAIWPSGRTRLALGGFGSAPVLAFDGTEANGLQAAAQSAYSGAEDQWATASYRQEVSGILAGRCLQQLVVRPQPPVDSH